MIYENIHSIQKIVVSTKKHCELPDARNIGYHRYHKNIRYHRYRKKWNISHEKDTISKRRVRLVPKHLHVKVIKLFQPWGDRLWQFWKHPLCHLGEKMNEKQIFSLILWGSHCTAHILLWTWWMLSPTWECNLCTFSSFNPSFLSQEQKIMTRIRLPTTFQPTWTKRAQSRRHRPAHVQEVLRKRLHLGDAGVVESAERTKVVQRIPVQSWIYF